MGYNIDIYQNNLNKYKKYLLQVFNDMNNNIQFPEELLKIKYFPYLYKIIYRILIQTKDELKNNDWINEQIEKTYSEQVKKICKLQSGGWSQFIPDIRIKINKEQLYNYYLTIKLNSQKDIKNYLKFLNELSKMVNNWTKEENRFYTFKTFSNLDRFISHNDTLKIYFENKDDKNRIDKEVNQLMNKYNISKKQRLYDWGKDMSSDDMKLLQIMGIYDKMYGSYGERIAKYISNQILKLMKEQEIKDINQFFNEIYDKFDDMVIQACDKLF